VENIFNLSELINIFTIFVA